MKKFFKILFFLMVFFIPAALYGQVVEKDTVMVSRVEFIVNTTTIIENETYKHFTENFLPMLSDNKDRIIRAMVVGSASPEGKPSRNAYLSKARALKILPYINNIVEEDKLNVISNSDMFLQISKCEENDYNVRRGTYVEVWIEGASPCIVNPCDKKDTIYVSEKESSYLHDTLYLEKPLRRIPILAVKTNLLSDLLITPNIQAELYTHLWGLSLEFDYTFPWFSKDYDKYFYYQLLNGTAGIKKYFNKNYTGHYVGIYANTAIYDICPFDKDQGWQGELYGCGISYGYVFQNKKYPRLKFEPHIRLGWFNTRFDTYHASQPWNEKYYYNWYLRASDFIPRRFNMNYFGPIEIGFNFTFDLICLKKY